MLVRSVYDTVSVYEYEIQTRIRFSYIFILTLYIYIYINKSNLHQAFIAHLHSWPKISAPLVNMIKDCENESALLILLIFYLKKSQKSNLSLDNKSLKWEEISLLNKCFFSNTRWTQLLATLEILMSKISLKYIPILIHNFEHSRVIMDMKVSSHGFRFHIYINRRENKAKIPFIIHHNEKKTKNIHSDVKQKITELHKWL